MLKKAKTLFDEMCQKETISHLEWIVIIIAILLPLYSYLYMDTNSIIRCGIDVIKSIFAGRFGDYYDFAMESKQHGLMVHPPTYDIVFYLTVGIWEAPIGIAELIAGKPLQDNLLVLLYSKTLLFVFLLLSARMIKKIAIELKICERHAGWAEFMFLTSGFVFSYLCIAGQYDIIGIYFSLIGVYYYIKKDMKRFTLFFTIAIQYKFFPLFIFIPLLLLKVKKVYRLVLHVLPSIVTIFLFRMPFTDDAAIIDKNIINSGMIQRIFDNRLSIIGAEIPLSFLFIGAFCIYCYFKKENPEINEGYEAVYISFFSLSILFLSFPFFPYWILYLCPWIPLLYFMRRDLREQYFWIEMGMSAGIMFAQYSHYDWVFELSNTDKMLLSVFYPFENFTNPVLLADFVSVFLIGKVEFLLYGLYILCLVTMLILYRPKQNILYKEEDFPVRSVLWGRFLIQYFAGVFPFLLYFLSLAREWI